MSLCYFPSTSVQSLQRLKLNLTGKTCRADNCCVNENNAITPWEIETSQSTLQTKIVDLNHRWLDFEKRARIDSMHLCDIIWISFDSQSSINSTTSFLPLVAFEFGAAVFYRKRLDKKCKILYSPFYWRSSRSKIIPANNSLPRDSARWKSAQNLRSAPAHVS